MDEQIEQILEAMKAAGRHAARGMDERIPDAIVEAAHSVMAGTIAELESQNGRLREALVKIKDGNDIEWISVLQDIARAALAPPRHD